MIRGMNRNRAGRPKKRHIVFAGVILTAAVLFFGLQAYAAETDADCGDDLTWSYDSDTGVLTITGSGEMDDYGATASTSAPWYTYRASITEIEFVCTDTSAGIEIGEYAFRSCTAVTAADISGATGIGGYAFYGCSALTELSGYDAVTSVGDRAFYNCQSLTGLDISNLTSIGSYAFYNNYGMTGVTLNAAITEIPEFAFQRCMNLESVVVTGELTSIGNGAFYQCYSLDTLAYSEADADAGIIYIADTVKTIGTQAFYECASYSEEDGSVPAGGVSSVVFLGEDVTFTAASKKTEAQFYSCAYLSDVTLPSGQTEITPYLFSECSSLETITIPETVTAIGKYAFSSSGLTEITIPARVTDMGGYVFSSASALAEVSFAEGIGLTAIPEYTFSGTALTEVVIPDSVSSIGAYAFKDCTVLGEITFGTGLTQIGSNALYGCTSSLAMHFTGEYTYTDTDGAEAELSISSTAFNGITAIAYYPAGSETWPSGTAVSTNATYGATSLTWAEEGTEVIVSDWYYLDEDEGILYVFPDGDMSNYSMTSTPWYSKRASITEIVFGYDPQTGEDHTVTSIGSYAFYGFTSLESVTIPASVTSIGDYAFYRCQQAESGGTGIMGSSSSYAEGEVTGGLQTLVFEDGSVLTEIGSYAFAECGNLSDVIFPESLKEIGSYAFYQCGSSVSRADLVYTLGSGDLSSCSFSIVGTENSFREVQIDNTALTSGTDHTIETTTNEAGKTVVTITLSEEYLESLEAGVYSGKVLFGTSSAGTWYFTLYVYDADTADEDKVTGSSITVSTGLDTIDLSCVESIGEGAFEECACLQEIVFGSSLETIGSKVFYGCSMLTEVSLPDSVQSLGSYAFADTGLEQITLQAGLSVGSYAFSGCTALTDIGIGDGTEEVTFGSYAFSGCTSLTEVVLSGLVTKISDGMFNECTGLTAVTLEGAVTEIGDSAFYDCTLLTSVTGLSALTSLGDNAFYNCTVLAGLELPESLTNDDVGDFAFYKCVELADENGFIIFNGVLYSYVYSILGIDVVEIDYAGMGADAEIPDAENVVIDAVEVPETVTEIANYTFYQIISTKGETKNYLSTVTLDGLIFTCEADAVTFEEYAFSGLPLLAEYSGYTATIYYPCTDAEAWEAKLAAYGLTGSGESLGWYYSTNWNLVAEPNHDYGEGTVTKEATCTEDGEISYTCSICGESTTEVIDAAGHSRDEGVVSTEATCTEDGSITYTCTVCGETLTEAIAAAGHSWDEGVVNTEATCTAAGSITYTCTVCGETYTEAIAAAGHSWDEGTVTTPATCVDDGEMTYTCTVCGETYTEVITATGEHDYEGVITKEATCVEAGEKAYICTTCGDVAETEVIAALSETGEHSYTSEVTTEATCAEDGEMTYTCTVCGDTYTVVIEATGEHDYEAVVTEPTETEQGYTTYTCTVCGDTYVGDYTDPTGSSDAENGGEDGSGSEEGSGNGSGEGITGGGTEGGGTAGGGTVTKKAQKITVKKTVTKTIKVKKLKKKAQTFKVKATAKGKVTFKKKSGSKKVKISKKGRVTVKKGTGKGTYKMKVQITAAKTASYKKAVKTITVKVKVK